MKKIIWLFVISFLISCNAKQEKVVYVENFKLHNDFTLTNELEVELQNYSNSISYELDSFKIELEKKTKVLEQSSAKIPQNELNDYRKLNNHVNYLQGYVDEKIMERSSEFDAKIWERLNVYVKEYALENDIDILLGASGTGNLMYAKEEKNITEKLIIYCNDKYAGK